MSQTVHQIAQQLASLAKANRLRITQGKLSLLIQNRNGMYRIPMGGAQVSRTNTAKTR